MADIFLQKKINPEEYIYPMDRVMSEKIYKLPAVKASLDIIFKNGLDKVNRFIYSTSYAEIEGDHRTHNYLVEGCSKFGVVNIPHIYLKRSYRCDVECIGYTDPVVIVPDVLLEKDDEIIKCRMYSVAASIAAEHHKLGFMIWMIENLGIAIKIPILDKAVVTLLYEWTRCRSYSLDRAVLLSVGDLQLSLKNILCGSVPDEMLENFVYGDDETFSDQVEEFEKNEGAVGKLAQLLSMMECEIWYPARYGKLKEFYNERFVD